MTEIGIDDLPDADDRDGVLTFARSFNGYIHYGSAEACSNAALERRRLTLTDLRNELFWNYRTINHLGDGDITKVYKELLPFFISHLKI